MCSLGRGVSFATRDHRTNQMVLFSAVKISQKGFEAT